MFVYSHIQTNNPFLIRERTWNIPEAHIVEMWIREAIPGRAFTTSDGNEVTIISIGKRNAAGGPDFNNADMLINGRLMHGAIEIHRTSGDWIRHHHHQDTLYDSVILHVVMRKREPGRLELCNMPAVPMIVLEDNLRTSVVSAWNNALQACSSRDSASLPCADKKEHISFNRKHAMLQLLTASRFHNKCKRIRNRYHQIKNDFRSDATLFHWKQLFYELLMESLGYPNNKQSMIQISRSMSGQFWRRVDVSTISTADRYIIFIGSANLLSRTTNDVPDLESLHIQERWKELQKKYPIETDTTLRWNYGATRASNAPHRRLMSMAAIVPHLFSDRFLHDMISSAYSFSPGDHQSAEELKKSFSISSEERIRNYRIPQFGLERIDEIIVNIVAPYLMIISDEHSFESLKHRAVQLYFHFASGAINSITSRMQKCLQIPAIYSSGTQQGMIELHNAFCSSLRCHECLIGRQHV